jgi:hypothetical protein
MGFIQIVVMVCQVAQPDLCEEQHLQFAWQGTLQQCIFSAQPYIAQWIGDHPEWTVKSYHCEYPSTRKKGVMPGDVGQRSLRRSRRQQRDFMEPSS